MALTASFLLGAQTAAADPLEQAAAIEAKLGATFVATQASLLAKSIVVSRDAALEEGVAEIPASIRASLEGYVPDATLARVRWRAGGNWDLLAQSAFMLKDAQALTLDYVIVFADEDEALHDPKLWAHELKHVMQYEEWGIDGFATRYVNDNVAVESDATEYRWEFMKQRGLVPAPSVPTAQ